MLDLLLIFKYLALASQNLDLACTWDIKKPATPSPRSCPSDVSWNWNPSGPLSRPGGGRLPVCCSLHQPLFNRSTESSESERSSQVFPFTQSPPLIFSCLSPAGMWVSDAWFKILKTSCQVPAPNCSLCKWATYITSLDLVLITHKIVIIAALSNGGWEH